MVRQAHHAEPSRRANHNDQNSKPVYDLEERTCQFAKVVMLFVKTLPKKIANILEKSK